MALASSAAFGVSSELLAPSLQLSFCSFPTPAWHPNPNFMASRAACTGLGSMPLLQVPNPSKELGDAKVLPSLGTPGYVSC